MATTNTPITGTPLDVRAHALALHDEGVAVAEVAKHLGLNAGNIYNWRTNRSEGRGPTLPNYTLTKEDHAWLDAMQLMSSNGSNGSHVEEDVQEEDSDVADVVTEEQVTKVGMTWVDEAKYAELLDRVNDLADERDAARADAVTARKAADAQEQRAEDFAKLNERLSQRAEDAEVARVEAIKRMVIWRDAAKDALNDGS